MPSDLPTPDAALRAVSAPEHNPLGTAGLEFVEFASRDPQALGETFTKLGFKAIARHISKDVTLFRQGEMNFLINAEPDSFAARYAEEYGAGICAIGIRVADAQRAFDRAIELGAWAFEGERIGAGELLIPAIQALAIRISTLSTVGADAAANAAALAISRSSTSTSVRSRSTLRTPT